MTQEELQLIQQAAEEMRTFGEVTADTLKKLNQAMDPTVKAFSKVDSGLRSFSKSVESVAEGLTRQGGKFTNLSPAVDATTKGVKAFSGMLTKNLPVLGKAIDLAADAFGAYAKFVLKELSQIQGYYNSLGDISATAAEGVADLQDMFRAGGLATANLENFIKVLSENTQGLAILGAGVTDGAKKFTEISGALTQGELARRFLRLGMSIEGVTKTAGTYVANSARLGFLQNKTTEQAVASTQKYIEEMDLVARITGQTRQQQEEEARKTMVDARFRAKLAEMVANGQVEAAEELKNYAERLGGPAGQAAREIAVFGVALSKAGADANLISRDTIRQNVRALEQGRKRSVTAVEDTTRGLAQGAKIFRTTLKASGDQIDTAIQALDAEQLIAAQQRLLKEEGKLYTLEEVRRKEQEKLLKGTNQLTKGFADSQAGIQEAGKDIKTLQMALALDAVPAVDLFTEAIKTATEQINRLFGIKTQTKEEAARSKAADKAKQADRPFSGAARPHTEGLMGTPTSVKPGTKPSGEALDVYDRKAMAQAAKMGLPDTTLKNERVQQMAEFYRKEDYEKTGGAAQLSAIRDLIGKYEGQNGNYNVLVGGKSAPLTGMTLSQVLSLQDTMISQGHPSTAVGKYQIIKGTLLGLIKNLNLDPNTTKFDQATQDKLADALIREKGFDQYKAGKISKEQFLTNLSAVWAALPAGPDNKGSHDGKNGNKSLVTWDQALASFNGGGIFGPKEGLAMLHGPEAVVPLPDGKSIPVDLGKGVIEDLAISRAQAEVIKRYPVIGQLMAAGDSITAFREGDVGNGFLELARALIPGLQNLTTVVSALNNYNTGPNPATATAQLERLDTLIDVMEDQVSVSNKILRAQQ